MDANKVKKDGFIIRFFKCLIGNIVKAIKSFYVPVVFCMFILCLAYIAQENDFRPLGIFIIFSLICKSFVDAYDMGGK